MKDSYDSLNDTFNNNVKGTARNIPVIPHNHPQKTTESTTTAAEIPNLLPRSMGSTKFPSTTLIARYPIRTAIDKPGPPLSSIRASRVGGILAIIEPMAGI